MRYLCDVIRDEYYPKSDKPLRHRDAVRGIVVNDRGEIGLIHVRGVDGFGNRDHYELPGGGIEPGETMEQAVAREIEEELGWQVDNIRPVGIIENEYNLLGRVDAQHFFLAHGVRNVGQKLLDYEKEIFSEVVFFPKDEILRMYDTYPVENVGIEIHKRDRIAVEAALQMLK